MRIAALIGLALLGLPAAAQADVIVPSSAAVSGVGGPAGLAGTYYHEGAGTTGFSVAQTIALMRNSSPSGRFVATTINYSGSDASSITSFLGPDRVSYSGASPAAFDLSDAILDLKGYLFVPTAGTLVIASNHDDAEQLTVGGVVALSSALGQSSTALTFSAAGYYPIDLIYANTSYYNVGSAALDLSINGRIVTSSDVVQSVAAQSVVPEPTTLALLGAAMLLLGLRLKRR